MSPQFTHLFQQSHNRVVGYSDTLARRRDMRPCFIDDDGNPVDVAQVDVLPQHAASLANALQRLDDLEVQYKRIVDAIAAIPGGEALLDIREPLEAVDIPQPTVSAGAAMGLPAPGSLATPTAPQSPAPVAPEGGASAATPETPTPVAPVTPDAPPAVVPDDAAMKEAEEAVGVAEKNVASKQQFLADQQARLEKARTDLVTATGGAKAAAEQEVKSAGIKVKSATTKLASANLALDEATTALDALTAPPAEQ